MFDLSLDYNDDEDLLLDWRPATTRLVCCGWGLPCILPEWWYRLLPRQRKVFSGFDPLNDVDRPFLRGCAKLVSADKMMKSICLDMRR